MVLFDLSLLPLPHQNKRRPSLGTPISSPLALFVNTQIALTISIVFEDRLPLIAPAHDAIERADEMYPPLSGHSYGTIGGKLQNSNKVCLTPFSDPILTPFF